MHRLMPKSYRQGLTGIVFVVIVNVQNYADYFNCGAFGCFAFYQSDMELFNVSDCSQSHRSPIHIFPIQPTVAGLPGGPIAF